jgi:adenosylcobinamide-phosphate synthase
VAPLFWFMIAGLPGAALYRFANTADAMWGYRGAWEWPGKWAARLDDMLSFVPARLTALALLAWQPRAWLQLRQQAQHTPSPNSGWPMAAMALRLQLRLGKTGVYTLNPNAAAPQAQDIQRSLGPCLQALCITTLGLALLAAALRGALA